MNEEIAKIRRALRRIQQEQDELKRKQEATEIALNELQYRVTTISRVTGIAERLKEIQES